MDEIEIGEATAAEREWCARLMAASEPWITLRRGFDVLLPAALDPEYVVLVARRGGAPCGFIRIHPRGVAGSPYVASVAVAESERGRGVGTALLDATEARYPKARYVFLCVSSFNTRARALYERYGYRLVGELPDYVVDGTSELLMGKRLA
ncbi:MAG: GNAT family N-acetyltransferase [Holophagales bacterium]|nr:GNAT family N-acetyltransferase [Holophagales bacterium]